jgi:hypothetical protein
VPNQTDKPTHTCSNCACFVLLDASTGRGRCRFFPPQMVPDRHAEQDDPEGKRWPVCFESEWCYQWAHK